MQKSGENHGLVSLRPLWVSHEVTRDKPEYNHSRHHNDVWFPTFRNNLLPPIPTPKSENFTQHHILWFVTYISEELFFFYLRLNLECKRISFPAIVFWRQLSTFPRNLLPPCPLSLSYNFIQYVSRFLPTFRKNLLPPCTAWISENFIGSH
jgi:hypothetical protein